MTQIPPSAQTINPAKGLYIKLGTAGSWEKESINSGILRFGYRETPFEAAVSGDWEAVRKVWLANRKNNEGVATSDVTQIRYFFEADVDTLWITFYGGFLWWCFAKPAVKMHQDGRGTYRETVDGWHNTDISGKKLSADKLSGNLLNLGRTCNLKNSCSLVQVGGLHKKSGNRLARNQVGTSEQ